MKTLNILLLVFFLCFQTLILSAQTTAGFIFSNVRTEGTHPAMDLVFEVHMNADNLGTYHIGGNVYLLYNAAAFGSGILGAGNVTFSKLGLINGFNYPLSTNDALPNELGIGWYNTNAIDPVNNNPTTNPPGYKEVTVPYQPLVEVRMRILDNTQPYLVNFNQSRMNGTTSSLFSWLSVTGTVLTTYDNPLNFGSGISLNNQLPVEWLSFTANRLDSRNVQLLWETDNETSNNHFMVQRSVDGQLFEDIGRVDGAGTTTSTNAYEYLDNGYQADINYYRIKQVDDNGSFSYSNIAEIRLDGELEVLFNLYPSPAKEYVEVKTLGPLGKDYQLTIYDMQGRVLHTRGLSNTSSVNRIEVSEFAKGIYIYEIRRGIDIKKTGRFMKI